MIQLFFYFIIQLKNPIRSHCVSFHEPRLLNALKRYREIHTEKLHFNNVRAGSLYFSRARNARPRKRANKAARGLERWAGKNEGALCLNASVRSSICIVKYGEGLVVTSRDLQRERLIEGSRLMETGRIIETP